MKLGKRLFKLFPAKKTKKYIRECGEMYTSIHIKRECLNKMAETYIKKGFGMLGVILQKYDKAVFNEKYNKYLPVIVGFLGTLFVLILLFIKY